MKLISRILFALLIFTTLVSGVFLTVSDKIVHAATFGNTGVELKLVGYNGYSPLNYFDNMEQSSTVSVSKYLNNKTVDTSDYYAVQTNITSIFGAYSRGSSSVAPFSDYIALANAGVLSAYARVGIVANSTESKNRVTISLSQNDRTVNSTSTQKGSVQSGVYFPHYYQTQPIAISSAGNIEFSYTNLEKSSIWSKADFKLFEPSIVFKTTISGVTLSNTSQTVYHNDVIKLNATNSILNLPDNGTLLSHFKNVHKIQYEITEGQNIARIIGNYLYFEGDISGTVKVRAKSLSDSEENSYLYSDTVTFNYVTQKKNISVTKNFPDGAAVVGEGIYYLDDNVTLAAVVQSGYTFDHWLLNGNILKSKTIHFVVGENNEIELYLIKDVVITEITVIQRYYDATTEAQIDAISVPGLLAEHDVRVSGLSVAYYSSGAGTKSLMVTSMPVLTGSDAIWYRLSGVLPAITGSILPLPATVTVEACQKVYGSSDPTLTCQVFGVLGGENLAVTLIRESGENVGTYTIDVLINNPNYQVSVISNNLTITPKPLGFGGVSITKVYDKSSSVTFDVALTGVLIGDSVKAAVSAQFASADAGQNKPLTLLDVVLTGGQKDNYQLTLSVIPALLGTITPLTVDVILNSASKIYGSADPEYKWQTNAMLDGDILGGSVTRQEGEQIGTYSLIFNHTNTNYVTNIQSNKLTILPKNITVTANSQTKVYGFADPVLTYTVLGLVQGDVLGGALERTVGEQVGTYTIYQGTLSDANYIISFVPKSLTITPRALWGEVIFEDKVYDGNIADNGYTYRFFNIAFNDRITLDITAVFECENSGLQNIAVQSYDIDNRNYTFDLPPIQAEILPRPIIVTANSLTKVYGNPDPTLTFTVQNTVAGEFLEGALMRLGGENVGSYSILNSTVGEHNTNYLIEYQPGLLTVIKRAITVETVSQFKFYAQTDPEIIYRCVDSALAFNDTLDIIITGKAGRVVGETPGLYAYQSGSLRSQNNNYDLTFIAGGYLTIKKIDITVTAQNMTKVFGDPDPILTYSTSISAVLNFSLTRSAGENVGSYTIDAPLLYHAYYQIEFVGATMQILPRPVIIRADDKIKYYGNRDPVFTASVAGGILIGDRLEQVLSGNMTRQQGEQVGTYTISQNTLQINSNYSMTFEQGVLVVAAQPLIISADVSYKTYKQPDPVLGYTIHQGFLAWEDKLSGSLMREYGEEPGQYIIGRGTLSVNSNYTITFEENIFTVEKAQVTVYVADRQKMYGDPDPVFDCLAEGLPDGEYLSGYVGRQTGENVGQYAFTANLENAYCHITYQMGRFEIIKREITLTASSHTVTYGQSLPELTYSITKGSILPQDELVGSLYKMSGANAGVYEIHSTFNLGKNYRIDYIKGYVTILPREITIFADGASKIYGSADPALAYTIIEGDLLEGDTLGGMVNRQPGENVGIYQLIPSFSNINYQVILVGGTFLITPRQVHLHAKVTDKIYDGTTVAYLHNITVSNLIDKVELFYQPENCASYASVEVGNNIVVSLHDISLVGQNAENYQLILPTLTGNISYDVLSENALFVLALSTQFRYGVSLVVNQSHSVLEQAEIKRVVKQFDIRVMQNDEEFNITDSVQVELKLDKTCQNVKVYIVDSEGISTLLESSFRQGLLSFQTSSLGEFIIVADNMVWLDILTFVLPSILLLIAVGYFISKRKSKI